MEVVAKSKSKSMGLGYMLNNGWAKKIDRHTYDVEPMVQNILDRFHQVDDDQMKRGMEWYDKAKEICVAAANEHGFAINQIVGVMAVLSAALDWDANAFLPAHVARCMRDPKIGSNYLLWRTKDGPGGKLQATDEDKKKCVAIMQLDPATCTDEDVATIINGIKTANFFRNIMGYDDPITVDRWAMRVAINDPFPVDEETMQTIHGPSAPVFKEMERAYQIATERLRAEGYDVTPRQVQAITWEHIRDNEYVKNRSRGREFGLRRRQKERPKNVEVKDQPATVARRRHAAVVLDDDQVLRFEREDMGHNHKFVLDPDGEFHWFGKKDEYGDYGQVMIALQSEGALEDLDPDLLSDWTLNGGSDTYDLYRGQGWATGNTSGGGFLIVNSKLALNEAQRASVQDLIGANDFRSVVIHEGGSRNHFSDPLDAVGYLDGGS